MIITIDDMRRAGICPHARHWFARHRLDWRDFAKHGIALEKLRATGDVKHLINRAEAAAMERLNG